MKLKLTTSMLLIGAVTLGAFIWFFERNGETSHQKKQRNKTVFAVYPESIHSILTERAGAETECSKASGTWRLVRPTDAPVNTGIVEKMIAGMARVERGELIAAETLASRNLSASDYGFDDPRAKITFKNNRGTFTWLIGRNAPLGDKLYIMAEGAGDIIAAPQTLLNLVPEDAAWIRDHALFRDDMASVCGIDLRRPTGFIQLRRPEGHEWIMQQPHKSRADVVSIHALLEKILAAHVEKFITDEKTDLTIYGIESPAFELTLFTQDEKTQTLRIGKPCQDPPDTRYAKWTESDSVFTVSEEWIKLFDIETDQLRNRHILGAQPARITNLQIARGEQQIDLTQTNGTWQITRPARWIAESSQVKEVLQTLAQVMVLDFVDAPSAEQALRMTNAPWSIRFTENETIHTLRISETTTNKLRLVQRNEEPSLYATDASFIDDSIANPLFYRTKTVLQCDPTKIEKITQQEGEKEWSVQSKENSFISTDPTRRIQTEAVFDITTKLLTLQAASYVAFNPDTLTPYGLDKPTFRISITLNGTDTLGRVILLGNVTKHGRFAMLQGENVVFTITDKTAEILTQKVTQPIKTAEPTPKQTATEH